MTEVAAWGLFPLAALAVLIGLGLLAERVARLRLESALLAPLGFCAAICLVGPGYALGLGSEPAIGVLLAGAVAGLALERRTLRERLRPGFGLVAGAGFYGIYTPPVARHGRATFLGYNFLNDTAIHLALVDYLDDWGRRDPSFLPPGTFRAAMDGYVGQSYPLGSHELLAAVRELVPLDAARLYQPFLALCAALAASGLYAVLRASRAPAGAACAAAVLAPASQLLFSFNLQGGIKEISFVTALAALAGCGLVASGLGAGLLLGLCALAAYAIYGVAALGWLAPAALLVALPLLRRREWRALGRTALAAGAVFVLLGVPTIVGSLDFYERGEHVLESQSELGPLGGPLRNLQASGIWLNGDYRQPPTREGLNEALIWLGLALAAVGVWFCLRRRLHGPLLFALPPAAAWLFVSGRSSPYIDAKLLAVLSPAVLLMSAVGVGALHSSRLRRLAPVLGVALVAAVGVGDGAAYRIALHAPMDRLDELGELGDRYAGRGQIMLNEFEEYAKHFARRSQTVPPYEAWTTAPAVTRESVPLFGHAYTLDELTPDYVTQFDLIALRRSPAESRPPAGYELDWRGRWYEVWRRVERVAFDLHEPLGRRSARFWSGEARPGCSVMRGLSRDAGLIAAERPAAVLFDISQGGRLPPGWNQDGIDAYGIVARGAGTVRGSARTGSGRHTVWIRGRSFRDDQVFIDGRRVGTAHAMNGANQWIEVGRVELAAGPHVAELRRPRGSLAPGDRQPDSLGPIVLMPDGEARLVRIGRGEGERLCGRNLDWVEVLPGEG